jgi:hypothetical protein
MHVGLERPSAVTGGPRGGSGGSALGSCPCSSQRLGSHPCSLPIRRPGKGSGGPTPTVEVAPSRAAGVGPSGAAMGAAPAVGVGPSGASIGARPTTGGRAVEGNVVCGEEQLEWIRGTPWVDPWRL